VYGWRLLAGTWRTVAPARLAEIAAAAPTGEARERAAVDLASAGPAALPHLRRLLGESADPCVRAACAQGLGDQADYGGVDGLIQALRDDSPLVRARSSEALSKLLRRDLRFPVQGKPEARSQAIARIEKTWKDLCRWSAVEYLKKNLQLAYFYDRHTGELFEGPASTTGAVETPSGPYKGMPAGVRAHVFTCGKDADEQDRFIAYLSISAPDLRKHGVALAGTPASPAEREEPLVICRPGEDHWVYANSPEGLKFVEEATRRCAGKGRMRACRPE
jgi:HEAT repeat protein